MSVFIARNSKSGVATAAGLVNVTSNLVAFILIVGLTSFIQYQLPVDVEFANFVFFGFLVAALVLMFLAKNE